jgi:hypothetical protein
MIFSRQKAAFRVFLGTLSDLAVLGVALSVIAIPQANSRRTAADYTAAVHKDSEH